jgi:ABC-type transport system involved in cytochrome bd biosynthesis fused ATPase/permease subunit
MDLADVAEQPQATLKGHRAIEHPPERIAFKQVHFHYPGSTQPVFDGIDLLLERGRSTAIVGPNGAGKTTLVKLLARLYDPQAGAILIDGVPLSEFSPDSWRREIAVIFQDFVRYETTLAENIGVGSIDRLEDREVIAVAARKAGLGKLVSGLEYSYDTGWPAAIPGAGIYLEESGNVSRLREPLRPWREGRPSWCSTNQPPVLIRRRSTMSSRGTGRSFLGERRSASRC